MTGCSQDRGFSGDKTGRMVWLALLLFSGIAVAKTDVEVEVLKEGSCRGREEARSGAKVTLDYEGILENKRTKKNGKKFTSTYGLSDPYTFNIGKDEVIPGLEQGLIGFCAGSELILYVPSELAYGEAGAGDTIPPRTNLIFEVVIIDVKIIETDHERNVRLEAKAREEEAQRRVEELENRKRAEIKAKEDYERLLAEEQERRELHDKLVKEQQEKNRVAELKAKEVYDQQIAEEQKRREEQQELVRQELIRREEHQKLLDEELERRKAQQELVRLELIERDKEDERIRQELIRRDEHQKLVEEEKLEERNDEHQKRNRAEQDKLAGVRVTQTEEEKAIEAARKYFQNRRRRIRQ